ncbi:NADH-dependent flavin oxidoreductase [Streptococcus fryi]
MVKEHFKPLFVPLDVTGKTTLANRFVLSPMVTNSSHKDGSVSSADLAYARRRAKSAPLQITGAAYVNPNGQLFEFGFNVSEDRMIEGLSNLAKAMKSQGAKAILQLTHAGRFATHAIHRDNVVYGPSPMTLQSPIAHDVKALTSEQLDGLVDDYAQATRRAIQAGFDGVEVSSAQRLLIQTFFSTFSNQRTDSYGPQNLENRSRFGLRVLKAVQEVIDREAHADFILGFRGTPEETRGSQIGYAIEDFLQFMDWALEVSHIDYLAIASWGHDVYLNKVRGPGKYFNAYVNQVVHDHFKGRLLVMATGGINTPEKALEALKYSDFVGASTPFIVDPDLVEKLSEGREDEISFKIKLQDLEELAIPEASFKDIVPLMDYGESLPAESRQLFRDLEVNYKEDK